MEQSDAKASKLKEELVNTKEALNRAMLEREVLGHEKTELGLCSDCRFCFTFCSCISTIKSDYAAGKFSTHS